MEEKNNRLQQDVKQYVYTIGRWCKFFEVLGIVSVVLCVLAALMMFLAGGMMTKALASEGMNFPAWVMGLLYLIAAGLEVPAIVYLMRAANAADLANRRNNNEAAAQFLRQTKKFWKYYGILTIVMLGICIVAILVGAAVAVAAAI